MEDVELTLEGKHIFQILSKTKIGTFFHKMALQILITQVSKNVLSIKLITKFIFRQPIFQLEKNKVRLKEISLKTLKTKQLNISVLKF